MSSQQVSLDGTPTEAGLDLCPVCGEEHDGKLEGQRVSIPDGYHTCKHDREYEGDVNAGVWYLHEVGDYDNWFVCPSCNTEFGDPNAELFGTKLVGECGKCGRVCEKEVPR